MFSNKAIVTGLVSLLMIFSFIPTSEAELWELLIDVSVPKGAIYPGENVGITGKVVDHAYKPISNAEVFIRTGADTTQVFTNPSGEFWGTFGNFQKIPGTYKVNVIASFEGMTGLASTEFQVKGDVTLVSTLQDKLSTDEAKKYLDSQESDFEKNPIGQTLFRYYQTLFDELTLQEKESEEYTADQIYLEQQRNIAEELRNQAFDESNPGAGTYGGYQYNDYINSLNPEIRDQVVSQLNFTKNTFEEAQKIRDEIIVNGGTFEEARQVFLDMISIPREMLEQFNQESLDEKSEENQENEQAEENSEN